MQQDLQLIYSEVMCARIRSQSDLEHLLDTQRVLSAHKNDSPDAKIMEKKSWVSGLGLYIYLCFSILVIFWNYSYPSGNTTPALFLDDWRLEDWARGCNSDWQQLVAVTCLIEDSGDCYYNLLSLPHLPFLPTIIPSPNTSCNWLEESFIPQSLRLSKYFLVRANNKLHSFINLLREAFKKM